MIADPQAGGYGMFKLDGKEVGGVGPVQNPGQPTVWMPYILVDDATATAKKIKDAGGRVFDEPFDVMGEGTMAVVADPAGATFGLWQPGRHKGFEVKDVPGTKYTVFKVDGNQIAGAQDMPDMVPQDVPSYWLVYFAVADADETAAKARKLGGREIVAPTDIPGTGRFAVLQDPQGGTFGLLQWPAPEEAHS